MFKRLLSLCLLLSIVTSSGALTAAHAADHHWQDEPNELSWEHFANCLACFQDYQRWLTSRNNASHAQAGREAGLPTSFNTLWIEGEAFGNDSDSGNKNWQAVEPRRPAARPEASGGKVVDFVAGHNGGFTRLVVDVPEAGRYRLWTRYWDQTGGHASFRVRILPPEMADYPHSWQGSSKGQWLSHKFDFVPFKREDDYTKQLHEHKASQPSQYVWASAPMVELPAGRVCIELAGLTHRGPYKRRAVDLLVLTQDPLYEPTVDDAPASNANAEAEAVHATKRPPSEATADADAWTAWTHRPGAQPLHDAPEPLATQWRAWRRNLLDRLESGETDTPHLNKLAQQAYFNEDWNLIGTPAQVRERIATMTQHTPGGDHWYERIEAEDFDTDEDGWQITTDLAASNGEILQAHYTNGLTEATAQITVPREGRYTFWIRHGRIHGYYNLFKVRFEPIQTNQQTNEQADDAHVLEFGDAEVKQGGGYRMTWIKRTIDLEAGDYRIVLSKKLGRSPFAYRKVDTLVLTNDSTWKPTGISRPPMGAQRAAELFQTNDQAQPPALGVWRQAKTWDGFAASHGPGKQDVVQPATITETVARGEVRSVLLHVRNLTDDPVVFTPHITGALADHASWRVVAYQLSARHGWQPMPLLHRRTVTAPPHQSASLWLTLDARDLSAGTHEGTLVVGNREIALQMHVEDVGYEQTPEPLVGGWAAPYNTAHAWEMFSDIGFNLIHRTVLPAAEQEALGIRRFVVVLGVPDDPARVNTVIDTMERMGLGKDDWTWELFDEPHDKTVDRWVDGAKKLDQWAPSVNIWCNPGTHSHVNTATVRAMGPYVDVFCPYTNHFRPEKEPEHTALTQSIGKVQLYYTTPCFNEKAPNAPRSMLSLGERALELDRDGWDFFCVLNYYSYTTTPWDDINAPFGAQAVSIYPGAHARAISTRNLEAVREAIQRWRLAHVDEGDASE